MKVLFSAVAAAAAQALTLEEAHIGAFNRWKAEHSKTYESIEEESLRFEVFVQNNIKIEAHNRQTDKSFHMALNHLADLTAEEFKQRMTGYKPLVGHVSHADRTHEVSTTEPLVKNWVEEGKVTAVKDQQNCGSCWSFSTTGSVEAANLIKNGGSATDSANILSEQELIDCSTANSGCNGGLMDYAFQYLKKLGNVGDDTESSYPYTARDGSCKRQRGKASNIRVTGYVDVPFGDEDALKNAVGTVGPVSIAIEADQDAFHFYSGGVLKSGCGQQLDHGVLLAGYGTSEDGVDYWLVKNSWGPEWGEKGYIKIERGKNLCGIANSASYPTVA